MFCCGARLNLMSQYKGMLYTSKMQTDNKYFLVARLHNGLICFVANLFAALIGQSWAIDCAGSFATIICKNFSQYQL